MTIEQAWHKIPGGTATSIVQTMRALRERDDVEVVGVSALHASPPDAAFRPPVPVRRLPLPRTVLYRSWHRLRWPPVQLATGPVDVVHATTFAIPPRRGPLVVTVHDLVFLSSPEHFTTRGNRFFRHGLALTRQEADLVIVPSVSTWEECVAAGIDADRLRLVPHGVRALPTTDEQVSAIMRRRGVTPPYVLWCGTLEPRKNLSGLLTAFRLVAEVDPDITLVLVGPEGWGDVGVTIGVPSEKVRWLGFVPDDELHALYAGARAFCYPSLSEGFGMPVAEALSHGIPVVTTLGTPMAEVAGPAGLSVDATDHEAIAGALRDAIGPRHDELAAHARARAALYTWEAAAERTVGVYREVT